MSNSKRFGGGNFPVLKSRNRKRRNKNHIGVLLLILPLVSCITVRAADTNIESKLKSRGVLQYTDKTTGSEVLLNSQDLHVLAQQIELLPDAYYKKGYDDGYAEGESKVTNTVTNLIDVIYSGVNKTETVRIFPDRGSPDMGESVSSKESCGPYYCYARSNPIQAWDLESDTKKLITKLTINGTWDWHGARDDDGSTSGSYSAAIRVYNERGEQIGSGYFSRWGGTNVLDCMAMRIDTPTIYVELDGAVSVSKSDHGCGTGTATIDFKSITATYLVN